MSDRARFAALRLRCPADAEEVNARIRSILGVSCECGDGEVCNECADPEEGF